MRSRRALLVPAALAVAFALLRSRRQDIRAGRGSAGPTEVASRGRRLSIHARVATGDAPGRRPVRVLLCATGSVATVKVPELALACARRGMEVVIVVTAAARHMLYQVMPQYHPKFWGDFQRAVAAGAAPAAAAGGGGGNSPDDSHSDSSSNSCGGGGGGGGGGGIVAVLQDEDEWAGYADLRRDSVLHIDLRKWADVCVVAPCSANTLAKAAAGLSDNLVSCVLRAWDFAKPVLLAPAMNTHMWSHPATAGSLRRLVEWGYAVVEPAEKLLACGDTGRGAMAAVDDIVVRVAAATAPAFPVAGATAPPPTSTAGASTAAAAQHP